MDIRFLNTFLEVVETRHFGKAAENLYLTQSAVSARIKLLEEYFNTTLFVRNRNSIQITPAGERLIPFAKKISNELAMARQVLAEQECAHIGISATQTAMLVYMNQCMPDLFLRFSNISIRHDIMPIELITKNLHEHSVDIGITTSAVKSDDVECTLIGKIKLALCFKRSLPALDKDCGDSFINIDYGPSVNQQIYKEFPAIKRSKIRTSSLTLASELIAKTNKIAVMPIKEQSNGIDGADNSEFEYSSLPENCDIPIFLNKLKHSPNQGIEAMVKHLIKGE